jgi:hypothetical protein
MKRFTNSPRKILQQKIEVKARPEEVFPLLCPIREFEWISDWDCDLVYSDSGFAEDNCIFKTEFSETKGKDVWVVSRYDPNKTIQFIRVNEWRVIRYNIFLELTQSGTTLMRWEQVVTAISAEGERWLENYSQASFTDLILKIGGLLELWLSKNK